MVLFSIFWIKLFSRNVILLKAGKTFSYIQYHYSYLKAKEFRKTDSKLYFEVGFVGVRRNILGGMDGGSVEINKI